LVEKDLGAIKKDKFPREQLFFSTMVFSPLDAQEAGREREEEEDERVDSRGEATCTKKAISL